MTGQRIGHLCQRRQDRSSRRLVVPAEIPCAVIVNAVAALSECTELSGQVLKDTLEEMSSGQHILPSIPRISTERNRQALPYEPVCAVFRRYLHGQKLKFTPERAMILDAVLRKNGLFEAEALAADLKQLGHRVSRATVYRTLNHLHDAGILKQVFFDNKQSYYEVIAGRQANDYLICIETGRVVEFNSEKLRKLRDEICEEHGFEPLSHQFHIFGISSAAKKNASA